MSCKDAILAEDSYGPRKPCIIGGPDANTGGDIIEKMSDPLKSIIAIL